MKKTTKILLTIPSILVFSYFFVNWFPQKFIWLTPIMKDYYIQVGILEALEILQLVLLLRKLWSFKNLEHSKKVEWTWILILFLTISSLIFIWKKVDIFEEKNRVTNNYNT